MPSLSYFFIGSPLLSSSTTTFPYCSYLSEALPGVHSLSSGGSTCPCWLLHF
jgi:hypothetical protein